MKLFPDRSERLRREASSWFARLQGPASEADRAAFERWRDADPAHRQAYDRIHARFDAAGMLAGTEIGRRRGLEQGGRDRGVLRPFALAAGVALLLVASAAVLLGRPEPLMAPAEAEALLFATDIGEIRTFSLPDGSQVTLDTQSRLRVDMAGGQATLEQGRARFTLAGRNPPSLVVRAGAGRVSGRNATFDVALRGGEAIIAPLAGDVAVAAAYGARSAAATRLRPGQAIFVSASGERVERSGRGLTASLWPTGRLEFDNAPLLEVLAEANRYSRAQVRLGDPTLSRLRVTGTLRAGDAEGLARSLASAFGLMLERTGDGGFILRARPQEPAAGGS